MQQKWIIKLIGYDFVIEYNQGKYNQMADGLCRKEEAAIICVLTLPNPNCWDSIMESHDINTEIKSLKEKAEKGELGEQWSFKKGVLFYKN